MSFDFTLKDIALIAKLKSQGVAATNIIVSAVACLAGCALREQKIPIQSFSSLLCP
jgi:hypothetical protein